jgi:hypothetical protein
MSGRAADRWEGEVFKGEDARESKNMMEKWSMLGERLVKMIRDVFKIETDRIARMSILCDV